MSEKNEVCPGDECVSNSSSLQVRGPVLKPRYESVYDEESWKVSVALPGVRREDLDVSVENEILDLTATRHRDVPETFRALGDYPEERRYRLRLDVGPEVDPNGIEAKLEDGVLALRLPLRDEVKARSIPVN